MRVKDRLIELFISFFDIDEDGYYFISEDRKDDIVEEHADYLLTHGVTIQQWIPVSERLPEPFTTVLVQIPGEKPCPTVREGYFSGDGIWAAGFYIREPEEITHWMAMPEPPKESEA